MIHNYKKNSDGVIYQVDKDPFTYDQEYVKNRYDSYGEITNYMSHLRLGYILGTIKDPINSILDVGYGNGSFLKVCKKIIPECYGYDVTSYRVPEGVVFLDDWTKSEVDLITFFDVLEHLENPYIIKDLNVKYLVISLPWCHYESDEWFEEWKHRRPNEHLWHFDERSIQNFANTCGFEVISSTSLEDTIRGRYKGTPNILTVCLKKIK